jgi:hypothetical protein
MKMLCIHLSRSDLRMRNLSDKSSKENQNKFYIQQLFPENHDVYEIMSKIMVQPDRPHSCMTVIMAHTFWTLDNEGYTKTHTQTSVFSTNCTIGFNAATYFGCKLQPSSGSYKCWKRVTVLYILSNITFTHFVPLHKYTGLLKSYMS